MADYAPAMCQKTQRPRRCDRWIKLPERAGRCVAGIGEYLSADVRLPLIEGREIGLRHIDFAPHLEDIRRALRQLLGNIPDRPGIGRDIFAHQPVAPCRRADQLRSEEHTSELQSLMRISYAVFCLQKKKQTLMNTHEHL